MLIDALCLIIVEVSALQIQASTVIISPISVVFTYLTDTDKLLKWQTFLAEAEQLSAGAVGVGSKFRNVLRHPGFDNFGILTLEVIGEVLIFEPDKRLKIRGKSNIADLVIDYTLGQDAEKTIVQQITEFKIKGLLMLPISGLLNGFLTEQFKADLQNLKLLVESEQELGQR